MTLRVFLTLIWLFAFAGSASAIEFYFPIIADGFIPGSTDAFYVTELVINNPNNTRVGAFVSFFANDARR